MKENESPKMYYFNGCVVYNTLWILWNEVFKGFVIHPKGPCQKLKRIRQVSDFENGKLVRELKNSEFIF